MTWFKLDDGFHDHPKVLRAGNAPIGLWVRCCTWSASKLVDGWVSDEIVTMYGPRRDAERLVEVGLWERTDNGYWVPHFLDFNPSGAKVIADREAGMKRQQNSRSRRGHGVT